MDQMYAKGASHATAAFLNPRVFLDVTPCRRVSSSRCSKGRGAFIFTVKGVLGLLLGPEDWDSTILPIARHDMASHIRRLRSSSVSTGNPQIQWHNLMRHCTQFKITTSEIHFNVIIFYVFFDKHAQYMMSVESSNAPRFLRAFIRATCPAKPPPVLIGWP